MANLIYSATNLAKNVFFGTLFGKLALTTPAWYAIYKVIETAQIAGL